jgi:N-acyl-D-amino-acid deacylase
LSLAALGEAKGVDPLDAAMDLLAEEDNAVGMVDYYGLEEHVEALLRRPEQNVCTDGLMSGNPHPRAYGAFPRVLGRYVRERKVLSLSEAVRKMTSKPASVFGLKDRGRIFPGLKADLVLFDPETIIDVGTFENPRRHPIGIQGVWVNGRPAIRDGEFVEGALHGRVLKRQGA